MSNYTPIAARLRAKYAPGTVTQSSAAVRDSAALAEAIAEREAIAIFDGGLPPEWAAALAMIANGPKPLHLTDAEWIEALNVLWLRADEHGATFAAHGWTFDEVFGGVDDWSRDPRGACWRDPAARIISITEREAVYAIGRDQRTHKRPH